MKSLEPHAAHVRERVRDVVAGLMWVLESAWITHHRLPKVV
jgi:hypothetical protein